MNETKKDERIAQLEAQVEKLRQQNQEHHNDEMRLKLQRLRELEEFVRSVAEGEEGDFDAGTVYFNWAKELLDKGKQ